MRFLHTADWHIGKKLHGYPLLDDQRYIIRKILESAIQEKVDAIVIAGDLYDRSMPAEDAVALFNEMVAEINLTHQIPILAISGNHDSATRLSSGTPWFPYTNFYLKTQLADSFEAVVMGDTQFFLLPYFEPIDARLYFEDESIKSIEQAMEYVLAKIKENFDPEKKHVLVSHFFVSGSLRTDSETKIEVGGLDGIPGGLLADFDYVALGHLHNRQALQLENARYSGSPLKFSLSELEQEKGVFIVDTTADELFQFKSLTPKHDVQKIEGSFQELLDPKFYQKIQREDYLEVLLTDRAVIPNMMNQLRQVYLRILMVERLYGHQIAEKELRPVRKLAPLELITEFFEEMTEEQLTNQQQTWLTEGLEANKEADIDAP